MEKDRMQEQRIYEKTFGPTKVKFGEVEKDGKKLEYAVLEDEQGMKVRIENSHALSRLYYLFSYKPVSELRAMKNEEKSEFFTKIAKEKPRMLKVIFSQQHKPISIVSSVHRMMKWADIKKDLEAALNEKFGELEVQQLGSQIAYKLPVENKYVSAWLNVNPGNNVVYGRSAVRLSTRFRTDYDTASGGVAAPCHNWANLWQIPKKLFNVDNVRLHSIYKEAFGIENVKELAEREIHVTATGQLDKAKFMEQLLNFTATLEKFKLIINQSISTQLAKAEMEAILKAYDTKVGLPKYIIGQILNVVKEETVWGFAQAVSYVRTHGDIKTKGEIEDTNMLGMVRKLENISGEVLSIAPCIDAIKKQVGTITLDILLPQQVQ